MIELCQRFFVDNNPSSDYTIPVYSLIRGAKTRRGLQEGFGGRRIEELARRWFCVSSDLVARELIVHRTGSSGITRSSSPLSRAVTERRGSAFAHGRTAASLGSGSLGGGSAGGRPRCAPTQSSSSCQAP